MFAIVLVVVNLIFSSKSSWQSLQELVAQHSSAVALVCLEDEQQNVSFLNLKLIIILIINRLIMKEKIFRTDFFFKIFADV